MGTIDLNMLDSINKPSLEKVAFNEFVRDYKRHCRTFPASLFLSIVGYEVQPYKYYEAEEAVRDNKPMKLF